MDGFPEAARGPRLLVLCIFATLFLTVSHTHAQVVESPILSTQDAVEALSEVASYMLIDTPVASFFEQPTARALMGSASGAAIISVLIRSPNVGGAEFSDALSVVIAESLRTRGVDAGVSDVGAVTLWCPHQRRPDGIARRNCTFPEGIELLMNLSYPVAHDGKLHVAVSTFTEARDSTGSSIPSNLNAILQKSEGRWQVVDVRPLRLGGGH